MTIPSLGLYSEIIDVKLHGTTLPTPDYAVGRYAPSANKVFLFGHSTTALSGLENITPKTEILYGSETYLVENIETLSVEDIDMSSLLAPESEPTLVLMTCAGEESFDRYPDRLIITAKKVPENQEITEKSDKTTTP